MNLEGRKNNIYFDKTGKQILEGDLLQVFHFRTRNKIHYMYHIAVMDNRGEFPVLSGKDYYNAETPHYRFYAVANNPQRVYLDAKIIYERDYQSKRQKIKVAP